jgi:spermidine synthase
LLWVMPLGLYLLSFSVAFAANRGLATALRRLAPLVLLMAAASAFVDTVGWPFTFAALTLAGLFVIATALHAEMFAQRPDPAHLTQFYLAMSIGGVVGGLFCALLAPLIFNWTFEHPIMLAIAALLIRPAPLFGWSTKLWADRAATRRMVPVLIVAVALLSLLGIRSATVEVLAGIAIIAVALASIGNRIAYAAALVALMLCLNGWDKLALSMRPGQMERSFFGVSSIRTDDGNARILAHGTTVHGVQNLDPARETLPTAYYGKASGVGLALSAAPQFFGRDARIGAVGLGAGTMACYAAPGQTWRFYEIDPAVIAIASNPKLFTFLSKCLPDVEIALGDARLTLAKEAPASSDILVIDAFSSDTVPMHLLTREAFGLYRSHIAADGLLLVHISNRYLDLKPVVAAAQRDGWHAVVRDHQVTQAEQERHMRRSLWVALSPDRTAIDRLAAASPAGAWKDLPDDPSFAAWTDDYATILPVLKMR